MIRIIETPQYSSFKYTYEIEGEKVKLESEDFIPDFYIFENAIDA